MKTRVRAACADIEAAPTVLSVLRAGQTLEGETGGPDYRVRLLSEDATYMHLEVEHADGQQPPPRINVRVVSSGGAGRVVSFDIHPDEE